MQLLAVQRSSPLPEGILSALRVGTQDLHEHVEAALNIEVRVGSRSGYISLLEQFYGIYKPLEDGLWTPQCVRACLSLRLDLHNRRKASLLESDLRFLGLTTSQIACLPRCPAGQLPLPRSAAELAGCAYVVEGATLGGQIIGRRIESSLGLRPGESGARFFCAYGSRTAAMWSKFRRTAEEFALREEAAKSGEGAIVTERAVAAARRTFAAMNSWLVCEANAFPAEKQL